MSCAGYRLAFVRRGEEKPAVLYDNHSPKGHHRHVEGVQQPYSFTDVDQLLTDFMAEYAGSRERIDGQEVDDPDQVGRRSARGFPQDIQGCRGWPPRSPTRRCLFTSIEAARNLLTPNRLALLRAVRSRRPGSFYELAKIVGRDLKNVQDDLRLLESYGLIRMADATRTGKRRVRVPQALFDQIELKIAI